ncbi:MAG: HlyD family type I secretion periplasmic adaptor subunit [Alphaproteobacteria bacterium]|nr:HlyD family type I secretion periplasmic adaptor subunit [Alphaproteobacteria bacterium]
MPDVAAAARRAGHRFAYLLTLVSLVFLVVFVVWSNFAVLDEVTRGEAKIIPSSRVQVIQNLEGGIVTEILVREGSIVDKGYILLRIDNFTAASSYRENRRRYLNLLASVARLETEISLRDEILFPQEVLTEAPDTVIQQRQLLASRRSQLGSQVGVLQAQADQRRQEIEEMRSRSQQLERTLALSREELAITDPLVKEGVMPRIDLIRLQSRIAETEGELRTIRLSIPRAQTALTEADQRIGELRATQRVEAGKELNQLRSDLGSVRKIMAAGVDRVTRSEVRSPVRGTIKSLSFNTVGGVVQPGQNILEIVPLADTLLVEAKIRPADMAFLRPGQVAKVKITAYEFSIYGGLDAIVEQISADTIIDEAKKENFYRVQLRSDTAELMYNGKLLPIIPGMTATVDILTGKKSVFTYIMKPILKARDNALRER